MKSKEAKIVHEFQNRVSRFYFFFFLIAFIGLLLFSLAKPSGPIGLIDLAIVLIFLGSIVIFSFVVIRCPSCNIWLERKSFGRYSSIKKCPSCGVRLSLSA